MGKEFGYRDASHLKIVDILIIMNADLCIQLIQGGEGTSQVSGNFSVALRGGRLPSVFNFELGQ